MSERILADSTADIVDTGGIGGTLAGNALSVAAMRATLADLDTYTEVFAAAVDELIS